MKKPGNKIKMILRTTGYFAVGVLIFIVMGAAIHHENTQAITGFNINTGNKDNNNFIDDSDIYNILKNSQYISLTGTSVQAVDLQRLSVILNNNPYIKKADVYVGADGKVTIKVKQHIAILRVINNSGVSFYLDENGNKMPVSDKFTPRVEVATGLISDKGNPNDTSGAYITSKLYFLTKKIEANPFMNALVQQIYVDDNHELELVPEVGNFSILIGDTDRLDAKFSDLKTLYHSHPEDFPWNAYQMLNLKYANQVIGVKNANGAIAPVTVSDDDKREAAKTADEPKQLSKADKRKEEKAKKKEEKEEKKKKHKKDSQ